MAAIRKCGECEATASGAGKFCVECGARLPEPHDVPAGKSPSSSSPASTEETLDGVGTSTGRVIRASIERAVARALRDSGLLTPGTAASSTSPAPASPPPSETPAGADGRAVAPPRPAASASAPSFRAGDMVAGRYEMKRVLGTGAMGQVWHATDTLLHEDIALKIVQPAMLAHEDGERRFLREGRIARRFNHRNLVRTMNIESQGGLHFIVMEMLHGQSLRQWMDTHPGPAPRQFAVDLGAQVLLGLQAMHEEGVVHRDLKPANIFLAETPEGMVPKLMDFGLAKPREGFDANLTRVSNVGGTLQYMAPEQAESFATVDGRADLYSLGVILHELLAGHLPRAGVVSDTVPSVLQPVLETALSHYPEHRYQTAAEMRTQWLAAMGSRARSIPPTATQRPSPGPAAGPGAGPRQAAPPAAAPRRETRTPASGTPAPRPRPPAPSAPRSSRWSGVFFFFLALVVGLALAAGGGYIATVKGWLPRARWEQAIALLPEGARRVLALPSEAAPQAAAPADATAPATAADAAPAATAPVLSPEEERARATAARVIELIDQAEAALAPTRLEGEDAAASLDAGRRAIEEGRGLAAGARWDDLAARADAFARVIAASSVLEPEPWALLATELPAIYQPFAAARAARLERGRALFAQATEQLETFSAAEAAATIAEGREAVPGLAWDTLDTRRFELDRLLAAIARRDPTELARLVPEIDHAPYKARATEEAKSLRGRRQAALPTSGPPPTPPPPPASATKPAAKPAATTVPAATAPVAPAAVDPAADAASRVEAALHRARLARTARSLRDATKARAELQALQDQADVSAALAETGKIIADLEDLELYENARNQAASAPEATQEQIWLEYLRSVNFRDPARERHARHRFGELRSQRLDATLSAAGAADLSKQALERLAAQVKEGRRLAPDAGGSWDRLDARIAELGAAKP